MTSNQRFVMGTLGATLAGVAVGVLLAPKKGTETRRMIKNKANDLSSTAKKTFDENFSKGKDAFSGLSEKVSGLTEKVKTQFDSMNNGSNGSTNTNRRSDDMTADRSSVGTSRKMTDTTTGTGMGAGTSGTGSNLGSSSTASRTSSTTPGSSSTTPGGMSTTGTTDKFNKNS